MAISLIKSVELRRRRRPIKQPDGPRTDAFRSQPAGLKLRRAQSEAPAMSRRIEPTASPQAAFSMREIKASLYRSHLLRNAAY